MGEDKMFNRLSFQDRTRASKRRSVLLLPYPKHSHTTMGFRQAGVLAAVGFFLGIAFLRGLVPVR